MPRMPRLDPEPPSDVIDLTLAEEMGANIMALPSSVGMATNATHPPASPETLRLLAEIAGGQRAVQLRGQVSASSRGSTPEQVEEAFQEACYRAARGCRGETMGEVYVWLRKTTYTLLKDARERLKRERLVDHVELEALANDAAMAPPDEVVIKREEREELDALTVAILDRLCERERTIAILHSHGYQRKEIAERLGLTTRVVKRSVEEVLSTGRGQLAKFTGYGCADGHELVSRYAFGLALGRDASRAQLHLATCTRCGAMYERLDVWRERVAAVLPVPPVAAEHRDVVEQIVHAGTDALAGSGRQRTGLRRQAADLAGQAREHAIGASARVADPTPFAGVRPGAVAAAVAGCIAIGGGATYCVKEGVGPFVGFASKSIAGQYPGEPSKTKTRSVTRAPARVVARQAPVITPVATTSIATSPKTKPKARPKPLPPAPEDEFEPTSAGTTSSSSPTAQAASVGSGGTTSTSYSTPSKQTPAAAPAGGPGEFDGP